MYRYRIWEAHPDQQAMGYRYEAERLDLPVVTSATGLGLIVMADELYEHGPYQDLAHVYEAIAMQLGVDPDSIDVAMIHHDY